MFNGIILCGECHRKADCFNVLGGVKSKKVQRDLLFITMRNFYSNRWWEQYLPRKEVEENDWFFELIQEDLFAIAKYML